MPKGLNDTYAKILSQISDDDYEVAMRILHWLLFAGPLYIEGLAELAAMDMSAEPFEDIDRLWDPFDVLNICPNLLTTAEENTEDSEKEPRLLVRLAHISIREYLLSTEILNGQAARFHIEKSTAHASITECCLRYLRLVRDTIPKDAERLPLCIYAARNWLYHYGVVPETATKTHSIVFDFLTHQKIAYSKWISYLLSSTPPLAPLFTGGLMNSSSLLPLEVVSNYGYMKILKMMLESEDVSKDDFALKKALRAAYSNFFRPQYKIPTIKLLLQHGANFNGEAKFVTTLHAASYFGFSEIVEEELEAGADINFLCGYYGTALQAAVLGRHDLPFDQLSKYTWPSGVTRGGYVLEQTDPNTVQLLLDHGADPNLCGGQDGSALLAACYNGDLPCVKLLLAHGADPNVGGIGKDYQQSCLAAACKSGDIRIVNLLLDHGAYPTSRAALSAATQYPDLDILRLLLDKGADPNLDRVSDETPLQRASFWSQHKAAELLIQHGADVSIGGGQHGFPLQAAAVMPDSIETLEVLVSHGADVNQRGGEFGTALHAAAYFNNREKVQYLIAQGADIHAKGARFDSVMRCAIQHGNTDAFILLFKEGANMDTPGGRYGETLREMLATAPADQTELWLRTYRSTTSPYPNEALCVIVRKGETWQDIDNIVLDHRGDQRGMDASKYDCLLPN